MQIYPIHTLPNLFRFSLRDTYSHLVSPSPLPFPSEAGSPLPPPFPFELGEHSSLDHGGEGEIVGDIVSGTTPLNVYEERRKL